MKISMMSSILFASLWSATALQASEFRFVSADNTGLSSMCIAATESRAALLAAAATQGLDSSEFNTLYCNGMPLNRFISKYRSRAKPAETRFVFSQNDDTPLTQLCVAALSSNETYQQVKQQYFADDVDVGAELKCNGMPVESFVRRYREANRDFTASIQ